MPESTAAPSSDVTDARAPTAAAHWVWLALILLAAAWLRVGLAERMAPQRAEPDAYLLLQYEVFAGRVAREDAPPHFGFYPTFLARAASLALGNSSFANAAADASLDEHLRAAARPLVRLRRFLAWICVLGVAGAFFLVRELWGPRAGLLASALLAASLLHIAYSHQARPHAPHTTFQIWTLYLLLRQIQRPSPGRVAATALVAWMAFSSLQTGVFLAPAFLCALLVTKASWRGRLLLSAAPLAAYLLAQPFQFGGVTISSEGIAMAGEGHVVERSELNGKGLGPTLGFLAGYDPVLCGLALAGLVFALARGARARNPCPSPRKSSLLVLAAYAVPYLGFAVLNEATRDRYLIPLLPFLAALGALAVVSALDFLALRSRWIAALAVPLALALPLHDAVRFGVLARRPDTFAQVARWIEQQPDARRARIVTSPFVVLPLRYSADALQHSSSLRSTSALPWVAYQRGVGPAPEGALAYDLRPFTLGKLGRQGERADIEARLEELAPLYVVLEPSRRQRALPWHAAFEDLVRGRGARVALMGPDGEDPARDETFEYSDLFGFRTRLAGAVAFGPPLEVYRLPAR